MEPAEATVVIRDKSIRVEDGHVGVPDLERDGRQSIVAGLCVKGTKPFWALLTRRIRLKGSPRLLLAFGKCFPS